MTRHRRAVAAAAALLAVVALVAAGAVLRGADDDVPPAVTLAGGPAGDGRFAPADPQAWPAVCTGTPRPLPADLGPGASVVRCVERTERIAGAGTWSVRVVERADGDPTALLALLRREPPGDGCLLGIGCEPVACPAIAYQRPVVAVVRPDGRSDVVRWPDGVCPAALGDAVAEQAAAGFVPVAAQRVAQVLTEDAALAQERAEELGCPAQHKDVARVVLSDPAPRQVALPTGSRFWPEGATPLACSYVVDPPYDGAPDGRFVRGARLTAEQADRLHAALLRVTPAQPCTEPTSRFVVLVTPEVAVQVQVDGCEAVWAQMPGGPEGTWMAGPEPGGLLAGLVEGS